ncbi:hypothetical protein SAMN05421823_101497 [Catalinimonas alkaloidigena]|uniref:PorV/PorQ family protein n=1 Tax=Catalinimonas alkaloidigena TaxID=1075417 RepID=A0A1G8XWJ3_9BACT|nr:PorV/PorQ family protein [Catalinimonas alkaloidigena]SDJ94928.1 hypothetical protein SAMN05421823_101497 [Catalinimonas alkaloidigena]
MMKKLLPVWLIVMATAAPAWGQAVRKYSNAFLEIGVGARGLAMGGTQAALVNDVTAGYWNPAGLSRLEYKYEGALMHARYFAGIVNYDYGSFATRIDSQSVLGVSFIRFGVDDIPDTRLLFLNGSTTPNYDLIKYFSASDNAFLLSYARKDLLLKGLRLGASFKVIYRNVGNFANAWGFGLDAGAQYERKGWMLGLMVQDITSTFNAWSYNTGEVAGIQAADSANVIPENSIEITLPKMRLSLAKRFQIKEKFGVLPAVELVTTFDGQRNVLLGSSVVSVDPTIGIEFDYAQIVYLRGGVNNVQQIREFDGSDSWSMQPNFGIGIRIRNFFIDYALTDVGDVSETIYSNVFSLRAGF